MEAMDITMEAMNKAMKTVHARRCADTVSPNAKPMTPALARAPAALKTSNVKKIVRSGSNLTTAKIARNATKNNNTMEAMDTT